LKTVLIIGASRGLGLEFVRQYRAEGWLTLGTTRSAEQDALLTAEGATALRLDVADEHGYVNLAQALAGANLNVCVYNAGVYGPRTQGTEAPTQEDFDLLMRVNVLGAMRAIEVVAPSLVKQKGTFAFVSSKMGSIGAQSSVSGAPYRASKAALNSVVKSASLEWGPRGVTCITLHPGWVKTDMGGSNADIDPATSITGMRKVIAKATPNDNGHFFDYSGNEIQW
jgi:NAD(P)-dependent dehydrogenase (short-subunit alcohol dehydrogenase family)